MKYSSAISLAIAPMAMSKTIRNTYPVEARGGHMKDTLHLGGGNAINVAGKTTEIILVWVNPGANAETTTYNQAVTVTQTVTAGATDAVVGTSTIPAGSTATVAGPGATHTVTVGGSAGLVYTPSEVQAAVGDMVVFTFQSKNHTVTQSTFDAPCDRMPGGFDSGFQPNKDDAVNPPPQAAVQVMDTKPQWFYCAQQGHCGKGMVFSINPTEEKTQALFQAKAIQQKGEGANSAIPGNATLSTGSGSGQATTTAASSAAATTTLPGAVQTGTGSMQAGACVCAVTCGAGSFPDMNAQGLGNFGGVPGSIPITMAESI
ncbi:Cupredoxin [Poronia punctata]|nr:Cupredoxin [Poronia punctata]